jgi:hypothetical protein
LMVLSPFLSVCFAATSSGPSSCSKCRSEMHLTYFSAESCLPS